MCPHVPTPRGSVDLCLLPEMDVSLPRVLSYCMHLMKTKGHVWIPGIRKKHAGLGCFLSMGVSINGGTPIVGWFIMEHPTKMDDNWGYPYFRRFGSVWKWAIQIWPFWTGNIVINQWILVFRVDTCGWVNYNDLTILRNPGIMVDKGNHPQMAKLFRLVKYYNLPRCGCMTRCWSHLLWLSLGLMIRADTLTDTATVLIRINFWSTIFAMSFVSLLFEGFVWGHHLYTAGKSATLWQ